MADLSVFAVKILGVGLLEPLHEPRQWLRARLDQKMNMIGHKAIGVDGHAESFSISAKSLQICLVVAVGEKGLLPLISSHDHMIQNSGSQQPWTPSNRFSSRDDQLSRYARVKSLTPLPSFTKRSILPSQSVITCRPNYHPVGRGNRNIFIEDLFETRLKIHRSKRHRVYSGIDSPNTKFNRHTSLALGDLSPNHSIPRAAHTRRPSLVSIIEHVLPLNMGCSEKSSS
jgi:hypothetical protein